MKQPTFLFAVGIALGVVIGTWPLIGLVTGVIVLATRLPWLWMGVVLGCLRILFSPLAPPAGDLSELAGKDVGLTGEVSSFPQMSQTDQQLVVWGTAEGRSGKMLVRTDRVRELRPGDQVVFSGTLERPENFDRFDYTGYLAKDGIHAVIRPDAIEITGKRLTLARTAFSIRTWWTDRMRQTFPEPSGSFLIGILVGDDSGIPESRLEAFRRTGTVHVLALSGFNIGVIIAALILLFGRRPGAIAAALLCVCGFVLLVGPAASIVRAALMGGFLLLAQGLGRPQLALHALTVTGALMLLENPHLLRHDLGFDLSFTATAGILLLEPPLSERMRWVPRVFRGLAAATIAAGLATAPILLWSFGSVSAVSPIANLLVVPLIPLLMLGGFVVPVIGIPFPPLSILPAVLIDSICRLIFSIVEGLAALPVASVEFARFRALLSIVLGIVAGWLMLKSMRRVWPR